jgi:hypothetical protein
MLRRTFLMGLIGLPALTLAAPEAEASWVSDGARAVGRGTRRAGRAIGRGARSIGRSVDRGARRVRRQVFGRPRRRRR